jgi:hypothetical protein
MEQQKRALALSTAGISPWPSSGTWKARYRLGQILPNVFRYIYLQLTESKSVLDSVQ